MHSYLIKLVNFLINMLPNSRLFEFKVYLLNKLGFNIDKSVRIISTIKFSGKCELLVGSESFIGNDVRFYGNGTFKIGDNVDIAPGVSLLTGTRMMDQLPVRAAGSGYSLAVIIKDGAWIGAKSIILPGVTIGGCCIIAAGSIVTKDTEPYSLYAGNPAVFKKMLI